MNIAFGILLVAFCILLYATRCTVKLAKRCNEELREAAEFYRKAIELNADSIAHLDNARNLNASATAVVATQRAFIGAGIDKPQN